MRRGCAILARELTWHCGVRIAGGITLQRKTLITLLAALCSAGFAATVRAQAPRFATTKVESTDNVYIFRYQNHQAMFIVTPAGVIVTDPIGYGQPQAERTYLEEIRKITQAPIKYLIYSHHHYDHIAGGKVFKDAGATVIAHHRAKERLA
jgi:glyoxylase-like metal-dependent hydrolase (beta-lactamase superfamily II)